MINCTPVRPRSTSCRRNADQPDLSSLAPSQMPRISRKPSELTALATSSETLPPRPPSCDPGFGIETSHADRVVGGSPHGAPDCRRHVSADGSEVDAGGLVDPLGVRLG